MTDWLMVIITAIYVVATIFICYFNAKSAKASNEQTEISKKQMEEMLRQYNATNRPIVTIRFDIIRSGLLCFIVENEGPLPAHNVTIRINDAFINNLSSDHAKKSFRELKDANLYLASRQKITLLLGGQPEFSKIAQEKAVIEITYDTFAETTEIDLEQYGMLLVYNSPLEDIFQAIKKANQQDKKFYDTMSKKLPLHDKVLHVISLPSTETDALKYRLYKQICMTSGCTIQSLSDQYSIEKDQILKLIAELQQVDKWINVVPSTDVSDEMNYKCFKN